MLKLLDCTLRDGGYYTNWDFDKPLVDEYIRSMNNLPVDYLEIGYRSKPQKGYLGKYFYSPIYELEDLRKKSNKKLVIILNERDIKLEFLHELLSPIVGLVDMVRMAIDPQNLGSAIILAEQIKKMGFEVGFNVMYMSKWNQYGDFIKDLKNVDGIADYFYMVDSYGGVYPEDVISTMSLVKANTSCKIGFHGHNNLELGLINTLTAIEHGAEMIDATILGMGRGAGNLKMELLLAVLNTKFGWDVDFNSLGNAVDAIEPLLAKHEWGTNLPYMISGSNSLPQKDVMDWVTARFYSFNSIIRALQNQKNKQKDNEELSVFKPAKSYKTAIIIGGGPAGVEHSKAVIEFASEYDDICLIHASSKNSKLYKEINVDQFFCLVGNEGHRLESIFNDLGQFSGECVLPPYPRKMGTYIPAPVKDKSFELESVKFPSKAPDSHTVLALQAAADLGVENIYVVGYDGYQETAITQIERMLVDENEYAFKSFSEYYQKDLISLTPTRYENLSIGSIYSLIYDK
ncbi:aldolase catalytic domain-containing protein [Pedobacter sp. GR22-6]|uniref:aldolase catalytic domain-containing protein n=1 Tax=Pedobacter sp. GR22-6 TaxID=3127957 RepID=UPI00307D7284